MLRDRHLPLGGSTLSPPPRARRPSCWADFNSVCLLGIGGQDIGISAALVTELGTSKLVFEEHQELIGKRPRKPRPA